MDPRQSTQKRRYLDAVFNESFDMFEGRVRRISPLRNIIASIDATHQMESIIGNDITIDVAAKVIMPESSNDRAPSDITPYQKEVIEKIVSSSPEYRKQVLDYVEWVEILEDIFTLTFSEKMQREMVLNIDYEDARNLIVNRIFNMCDGEITEAEAMFERFERLAESVLIGKRLELDHAFLGETITPSRFADKTSRFRVAHSQFLDAAFDSDDGLFHAQHLGLKHAVKSHNFSDAKHPLHITDVLTVANFHQHQRCGIPIMWNYYLDLETWKNAEHFLRYNVQASSRADQIVHLRYAYDQLFSIVYDHQHNDDLVAFDKAVGVCAEQLHRLCPAILPAPAKLELCLATPKAEKAINAVTMERTGFTREA